MEKTWNWKRTGCAGMIVGAFVGQAVVTVLALRKKREAEKRADKAEISEAIYKCLDRIQDLEIEALNDKIEKLEAK